jgi:membrane protein YqaA with SNARE-associated domain
VIFQELAKPLTTIGIAGRLGYVIFSLPARRRSRFRKRASLMLQRLYDWTLSLARSKAAEWWLGVIAFVESSVFLIPADVLFIPMAIARPERAYRYALIATVASVLGGIAGWLIGYYAFEAIALPILKFYNGLDAFEHLKQVWGDSVLLLLITSGLAHLPPIKVVTILSGVVHVNIWLFIASAIVARGARFYALAWALKRWGEPIRHFIEHRLGLIVGLAAAAIIALYLVLKFAH